MNFFVNFFLFFLFDFFIFIHFFREKDEDERKKLIDKNNKKKIKEYYDMQVQEKKMMNAYEKNIDSEQAKIWEIDCQRFKEQEKEINDRV